MFVPSNSIYYMQIIYSEYNIIMCFVGRNIISDQ